MLCGCWGYQAQSLLLACLLLRTERFGISIGDGMVMGLIVLRMQELEAVIVAHNLYALSG